jgi:hypothetical protein
MMAELALHCWVVLGLMDVTTGHALLPDVHCMLGAALKKQWRWLPPHQSHAGLLSLLQESHRAILLQL